MPFAAELESAFDALWSVWPPRSITGDGVRRSLDVLETIGGPIRRIEIPSGTEAFDWTVPPEWKVREAYIITPDGRRICDVRENHLSLVGYSVPISGILSRSDLDKRLHSLPAVPEAIPYVTSYYESDWGFCLPERERQTLPDGDYSVHIDAQHRDGSLTLGEIVIPGETDREILLWSYCCHPAGAHHDLSANLAWAALARRVAAWPERRYTYRFAIGPETIGSLAYLHFHDARRVASKLSAGYVMTCLGRGAWNYKRSKKGDTLADRAADWLGVAEAHDYYAHEGSDELVFNRFGLPVGSLMRDRYNHFREYHTSLDAKETISFDIIADSVDVYERVLKVIEANAVYRCPIVGVPQLGRRGLYNGHDVAPMTVLYQLSDGGADLIDLARRTGLDVHVLADAAKRAEAAGVLVRAS